MAAFACFSSSKETSINAYKALIERFRNFAKQELGESSVRTSTTATFVYYTKHQGKSTHVYKDFIYQLRLAEFKVICILMCDNLSPHLTSFVRLVEGVKLQDGRFASAYYGEMKKIVTSFVSYFTHIIDDVVKKIDQYKQLLDNTLIMQLIDDTIEMAKINQAAFVRDFRPIKSARDQEKYDEVVEKHGIYMDQLRQFRETWSAPKQNKMQAFAQEFFELSLKKTNALCTFTHTYISVMLGDRIYEIGVSVGETVDRMNTNMRDYNEKCTKKLNNLIAELYEKNKEHLKIQRRMNKRSVDTAEVNRAIEVLKDKIEHYGNEETIARLELETRYWMKRMKDYNEIASILTKLQTELDKINDQYEKHLSSSTPERPGSNYICFEKMSEKFKRRKSYLELKILQSSKALITFFCVRGTDRILYTDSVGSYYCDEFNHQNYITDFGLKFFHVDCYGDFIENIETDPYYFDEQGRYTLVNGEKVHQCAPCTSQYKLGDDGLFKKITKDCGHSEKVNEKCRLEIKDLTDVEILPKTDIIDISGTLDSSSVKYLWESFGAILPEVLYKIAKDQPKNPIHHMSHILLRRRFEATNAELKNLKKTAAKYRNKIYQERKDKADAETRAWKSKLVKRRKPEESDDSQDWIIYNQQVADWQFVNSMGYYN